MTRGDAREALYGYLVFEAESWLFGYVGADAIAGQCRLCQHADSLHVSGQACLAPTGPGASCPCLGVDDLMDGIVSDPRRP